MREPRTFNVLVDGAVAAIGAGALVAAGVVVAAAIATLIQVRL